MNDFVLKQWPNEMLMYEIRPGDTYEKIACEFGISVEDLTFANPHINPNHLIPGQKLCIPKCQIRSCNDGCLHEVLSGENALNIAWRFNLSLDALKSANPNIDMNNLKPTQVVYIPKQKFASNNTHCTGTRSYSIEPGDTLFSICKKLDIVPASLAQFNPNIDLNDLHSGQSICVPTSWAEYIHISNTVSFCFPSYWQKITDERYDGPDGFFIATVSCSGAVDFDKICLNNRFQLPGVNPTVYGLPTGNSSCQENIFSKREGGGWIAVIMPFLVLSHVSGSMYKFFILIADKSHIQEIARTVKFF